MHVLLDECLPRRLRTLITGHSVQTVQDRGWAGKRNGILTDLINAAGIDALVTIDRNLPQQKNIERAKFAIVVLRAKSNRFEDVRPLAPRLLEALGRAKPGVIETAEAAG